MSDQNCRVTRYRLSPRSLRPSAFRWRQVSTIALLIVFALGTESRVEAEGGTSDQEAPLRTWRFAEGNSRSGFQTFFTLVNLADQPASVTAQYDRDDGIRLVQWLGIEPRARLSLNANDVVGPRAFGVSFLADRDIVVERTTIWGPGQDGETTVGFAPDGWKTWHFAEGTTRGRVVTYFVTQNLTDAPATVEATFIRDSGVPERRWFSLPPRARDAFRVNDLLKDTAFGATFRSDQDIVVERTILTEGERPPTIKRLRGDGERANGVTDEGDALASNAVGILGGLGFLGNGVEAGMRNWRFAEGSTRAPYQTTFVLFNPGQESTDVHFDFYTGQGGARSKTIQIAALGRAAVDPRDVVPSADFATSIVSDRPVIVERTYTSSGDGLYGALGATVMPRRSDSRTWYFAEGNTTGGRETYFILRNLADQSTDVHVTYFADGAAAREETLAVRPGARIANRANDLMPERVFATRFVADQDIVVERTVYLPGGSGFIAVGAGVGQQ